MISYKIYFIRHGLTEGNSEGKYIGSTDIALSPDGERELKEFKENFEYPEVQKVYSSPMKRCLDTAQILYPDKMLSVVNNLREYDFGSFEGKTISELKDAPDFKRWIESGMKLVPKGAEDMAEFQKRCEEGFNEIVEDMMKNKITKVAVIVHGGVIMNLLASHGYPKREPFYWMTQNGHGYTALLNTQLWQRDKVFEVFDPIPYKDELSEVPDYGVFNIEERE